MSLQRYEHGGGIREGIALDFSVNTNPLGMPQRVRDALLANLTEFERYPDTRCDALKTALSERLNLPPNRLIFGNGASDLIMRVCAALRPKRVYTLEPTFSEYGRCVRLFGGEIVRSASECELAFLCNPNNPTGALLPPERITALLELGVIVVLDECFIDFTTAPSMRSSLDRFPNLLILNAFTKTYAMAGLRLGYLMCSDESLLNRIAEYGAEWSVSVPAQIAGLAALTEPRWLERTQELVRRERAFLASELTRLELAVEPGAANFILARSEIPLYKPLRTRGILVRDCSNFSGLDEHYLRVAVKLREENETLINTISEVLK
ncbi:MAG: pyridoxal phosphate-dependent class II aminotransferase [Oscillospiraceae bacterium]|jgi:threonine-phosphate decarboxylase|nr:pyridoxal phosphate-dependent class II aminotransferase [Oscillospiraceae bacterium]